MPFSGIIDPDQLAMLTRVLEDHCQAQGIVDPEERKRVAIRIVTLFESGTETAAELAASLDYSARDDRREA